MITKMCLMKHKCPHTRQTPKVAILVKLRVLGQQEKSFVTSTKCVKYENRVTKLNSQNDFRKQEKPICPRTFDRGACNISFVCLFVLFIAA
jgi:hypothetical protein